MCLIEVIREAVDNLWVRPIWSRSSINLADDHFYLTKEDRDE